MDVVNREYKDSLAKAFFRDDHCRVVRLINTLFNQELPENTLVQENTLDVEPLYLTVHNDMSFSCGGNEYLIMIEHQSTINENLPLRMMIYLGRILEQRYTQKISTYGGTYDTIRIQCLLLKAGEV